MTVDGSRKSTPEIGIPQVADTYLCSGAPRMGGLGCALNEK